ncbi:MAG TPA: amidohydrolase family protein [Candidatus Acidoferrum sp.]|nr:amidohydrolase family protein [Candidatus Acidoferrum sp.]
MKRFSLRSARWFTIVGLLAGSLFAGAKPTPAQSDNYGYNDSHFHLTNNIQEGPGIRDLLNMMGTTVGRSTVFGVPLQQEWLYSVDGDRAPTYYLHSDAPLYYYSFTDAWIAMSYKSLPREQQSRLDPMITGFNPADMYAVDHIRRVLQTFPGVFTGIGEFTIHKEFVSAKIPGAVASLTDHALDRILDFAAESGLVVILHNDIDIPFAKDGSDAAYFNQLQALFKRHPKTTIIWAHMGLGRTVRPPANHTAMVESLLSDPALPNLYVDISWDEVAKYFIASPDAIKILAAQMRRHPDRFLFGSDGAAPMDLPKYLKVFQQYDPLWKSLDAETSRKVRLQNYERIFNEGRRKVRQWESANTSGAGSK